MKANEFVKEHGFQYTRNLVRDYPNHTHVTGDGRMFINENTCVSHIKVQLNELVKIDELKRIVESHELVEKYKKVRGIRFRIRWGQFRYGDTKEYNDRLKQAIADMESCMEVNQ